MTILEIVNQALDRLSLPNVNSLESSTDAMSIQAKALGTQIGNRISLYKEWQKQLKYFEIDIDASGGPVDEYALENIPSFENLASLRLWDTSNNYKLDQSSLDRILFNRTNNYQETYKRFVYVDDKIVFSSPYNSDVKLLLYYKSKDFVKKTDTDGNVTFDKVFVNNTDEFILEDELLIQGLVAALKKKDQLQGWEVEEADFQGLLQKYAAKDSQNFVVDFSNPWKSIRQEDNGYFFS